MPWKGEVKFGSGAQRGAGITGFHQPASSAATVFSGLLFRGDSRPPTKFWGTGMFKEGFHLHAAGVNVAGRVTSATAQVHTEHGTTRGVVSASKKVSIGCYWAVQAAHDTHQDHGWVYAIYIENEVLAADAVWNLAGCAGRDAAVTQAEIMLKDIPGDRIYAARKAAKRGGVGAMQNHLIGGVVLNTNYTGGNVGTIANADAEWAVFSDATDPKLCV